jgi:hypothetical protein
MEPIYSIYIPNSKDFKSKLSQNEMIDFAKSILSRSKKVLSISFKTQLKSINYHFLMKRIVLPLKYRIDLYAALRISSFDEKINSGKNDTHSVSSFLLTLFLNDFYLLNGGTKQTVKFSNFFTKKSGCSYLYERSFFLRLDQDACRFLSRIRNFFDNSGLVLEIKNIFVSNMRTGYKFLNWYFRLKQKKLIVYPHNENLREFKNRLLYIMKTEKNNTETNIKIITYLIKQWYKSNTFCFRLRLRTYIYNLIGLMIKYIKNSTKITKNHISKLFTYFLSSYL